MDTEPIRIVINGQDFSVTARHGTTGGYDVDWLHHPVGYGSTSAGGPTSRADPEEAFRDFLAGMNPATAFPDRPDEDLQASIAAPRHPTHARPLTVRKA